MRLLVLALAAALPAASAAAPAPDRSDPWVQPVRTVPAEAAKCRKADVHQADRRAPVQFKKLNELPPAVGYMAVYRTIDGCEEPLTVVEYRSFGRR